MMIWSINDIQKAMRERGSYWWDSSTMKMWGTRVLGGVRQGEGGVFFVTSEHNFDKTSRAYSVRHFNPKTEDLRTVEYINQYTLGHKVPKAFLCLHDHAHAISDGPLLDISTSRQAHTVARILAGEGHEHVLRELKNVTPADDLLRTLINHGCPSADMYVVRSLMKMATRHHELCESLCNYEDETDREELLQFEEAIETLLKTIKATPIFSGDPRGATVKIVLPDGYSDSWGGEGVCVPRS